MNSDKTKWEEQLRKIKKRRMVLWFIFFSFPIVTLIFAQVTGSEKYTTICAIVWGILFIYSGSAVHLSRCPKCGEQFHSKSKFLFGGHNPFTKKCMNCGLELAVTN
jgi:hypothetical protein